jgi:hypothetical protein
LARLEFRKHSMRQLQGLPGLDHAPGT